MELSILLIIATFIALICFFANGEEVNVHSEVTSTSKKVHTLSQAKPELSRDQLLLARDRLCAKNHIRGFDVLNYEAVLVKTASGWITTIQRKTSC